jgi:nitrate reductase (NAD(P)H)
MRLSDYPEDRYRQMRHEDDVYGIIDLTERDTCFCWCFWSLKVPVSSLAQSPVIQVCAMDEAMNMQPRDMYVSVFSVTLSMLTDQ